MVLDQTAVAGLAITAIIVGTLIRTFLPFGLKVIAELQLAERENREPVPPKFHWLWGIAALANIAIEGIPMLASIDIFIGKIVEAVSPIGGFFIVVAMAMASQEIINRMLDTGIKAKNPQ